MLTPMNIAIIGGVVVLLLLMVKMRKDRTAAAKPASAPKERRRSRRADAVKQSKESRVKEPKGRRGRRGPASIEAATSQTVATLAPDAPFVDAAPSDDGWAEDLGAEPTAFADTVVPEPGEASAYSAVEDASAGSAWQDDDVVTAPGWPMPGELDGGWAVGDDTSHSGAAPVETPSEEPTESWSTEVEAEIPEQPETIAIVADPVGDGKNAPTVDAGWVDEGGFDPAAGWGDDAEGSTPAPAEAAPAVAEADLDDWSAGWVQETSDEDASVVEVDVAASAEADGDIADTWSADGWEEDVARKDGVATPAPAAVADDESRGAPAPASAADGDWMATVDGDDWSAPAGEAVDAMSQAEGFDWEIASAQAAAAVAPEAPVVPRSYADDAYDVFDATPDGALADASDDEADAHGGTSSYSGARSLDELFGFSPTAAPSTDEDLSPEVPLAETSDPEPPSEEPLIQWAALAPTAPSGLVGRDPAARWAEIAPIAPKTPPSRDPAARWAAISPIAPAGGAPKRDHRDTGDLSGRFALGGFAVQDGYQVVTGVTFRFAADDAPTAWVFGPCSDPRPGTLVIDVEGMLNCAASDIEVLDDTGFAPTCNGFTLRLTAPTGGPFAASGSYRVV